MNEVAVFNNQQFGEIRTLEEPNGIYFCGKDVASALGITIQRTHYVAIAAKVGS